MRYLLRRSTLAVGMSLLAFSACAKDATSPPAAPDLVSLEIAPVHNVDATLEPFYVSVSTDKSDYMPGETVTITGSGFWPGETINIEITEDPLEHPPTTLTATADEFGDFTNRGFLVHQHHLGKTFTLTASGADSWQVAHGAFTDSHNGTSVAPTTQTAGVGFTLTAFGTFPFSQSCGFFGGSGSFTYTILLSRGGTFPASNFGSSVQASIPPRAAGSDNVTVRASRTCFGTITTHDDFAGTITFVNPNQPPVANAGPPQTLTRTSAAGAPVFFNGTASFDPNGDPISYTWRLGPNIIATGPTPPAVTLGLGEYDVQLTVTDNKGASATSFVHISVRNRTPTPQAGADQDVFRTSPAGATVTLNASGSSDLDGFITNYTWRRAGQVIASGPSATQSAVLQLSPPIGHNIELTVTDNDGATAVDFVSVIVRNVLPVANAGTDQVAECTDANGALVTFNGSASSDLDGTIAAWEWFMGGNHIASGATPSVTLPLGTHSLSLRVRDNDDALSAVNDGVNASVRDTRAPTVNITLSGASLWPPDHRMVLVATGISASDACDPNVAVTVTVSSNEPVNGNGDGNTSPDWEVRANGNGTYDVWVRSERSGKGSGRTYTLTATATDGSGNTTTETRHFNVRHDNGN